MEFDKPVPLNLSSRFSNGQVMETYMLYDFMYVAICLVFVRSELTKKTRVSIHWLDTERS